MVTTSTSFMQIQNDDVELKKIMGIYYGAECKFWNKINLIKCTCDKKKIFLFSK